VWGLIPWVLLVLAGAYATSYAVWRQSSIILIVPTWDKEAWIHFPEPVEDHGSLHIRCRDAADRFAVRFFLPCLRAEAFVRNGEVWAEADQISGEPFVTILRGRKLEESDVPVQLGR
jgi:hypothetical protein